MSQVTATKSHNNSYFDNPTHTHSLAGRDTTFLTLTVTRSSGVQVTTIELGNGSRETPAVSSDVVAEPPADTVTSAPPPANSDDQGTSDGTVIIVVVVLFVLFFLFTVCCVCRARRKGGGGYLDFCGWQGPPGRRGPRGYPGEPGLPVCSSLMLIFLPVLE